MFVQYKRMKYMDKGKNVTSFNKDGQNAATIYLEGPNNLETEVYPRASIGFSPVQK